MRTGRAYRVDLGSTADGEHVCAARPGDLHQRETDSTGRPRDQGGFPRAQLAPLDHAQRRAVRGRQRRELVVRERGLSHVVHALQRRRHVLGVSAVAFAPHQAHRVGVGARGVVDRGIDDHAPSYEAPRYAGPDGRDPAGYVGALDAREVDRAPPARQRLGVVRTPVGAFPGPQVGVVQRHRAHIDQHLAGLRGGDGDLCEFEDLRSSISSWGSLRTLPKAFRCSAVQVSAPDRQASARGTMWSMVASATTVTDLSRRRSTRSRWTDGSCRPGPRRCCRRGRERPGGWCSHRAGRPRCRICPGRKPSMECGAATVRAASSPRAVWSTAARAARPEPVPRTRRG